MVTPSEPSRTFRHGLRDTWVVVGILLLVNLFVVAMTVASQRRSERHAEESAATTVRNLAQVLERDLWGGIQRIDLALFHLRQEMARQEANGGVRTTELNSFISRVFTQFPELSSIRTADAEGRISHGIGVQPGTAFSVADRGYFLEAKHNREVGLMISQPVVGRISGEWVVILARRTNHRDGTFAGVAYAAVTIDQLTRSMANLDVGPRGTVTLRGGNLEFYAKYPANRTLGEIVGRRGESLAFQALVRQGVTASVYKAKSGLDGIERTFAFTKVMDYPLYIHVGCASEDYLAQSRTEARTGWMVFSTFALLSSGLAWLLFHAWGRERQRALKG